MITKTITLQSIEIEKMPAVAKSKTNLIRNISFEVRQFFKRINPNNWFNCFAEIEITLEEFACKKQTEITKQEDS